MKKVLILLGTILLLVTPVFAQTWRVDDQGNITIDGHIFRIRGGSWTGLEGREVFYDEEPSTPAPMEMYMGNVWWLPSGRTYEGDAEEFVQMGLNTIRIPVVHQTLDNNEPQGREPFLKNDPSVLIRGARAALETVIRVCDDAGLYVILDIHSCNNYVGWRAGRLDDTPPWIDADYDNYDLGRENYSCDSYNETEWIQDLQDLAVLGPSIGCDNVMGIEIFNEPHDYTWAEWRSLIDTAYSAINEVNRDILVFAGGIGGKALDETIDVPDGDPALHPGWGENLFEAGDNPPLMPKDRLVYSPHTFGPSVKVQTQFMDPDQPECEGLEGDEAGDTQCNIIIRPEYIMQGWEEHFGYLKDLGYAISVNAWGGNMTWPDGAEIRMQDRWGWLPDYTVDEQWQNALVNYLIMRGICDSCYWSINPEQYNSGGLYVHSYDPYNNIGGWGTWDGQDSAKLSLLDRYWNSCGPGVTPVSTAIPVSTATPVSTETPIPTPTLTPTPVSTSSPAPNCNVSLSPAHSTRGMNSPFDIAIVVDSGSHIIGAYTFHINYDGTILDATGATAGADGYLAAANTDNYGIVSVAGYDTSGVGPGSNLEMVIITFVAVGEGTTLLDLTVDGLIDEETNNIENACGNAGSVTVTTIPGDTNGNGSIDIIDALLIAQYYVGLDPLNFYAGAADTNCDGSIDIVDALVVAQYYVGLLEGFCS